ncbi:MAG TPA: MlaD family protein [Methylophilaceae bacterium]|jgi:phospholipid/cholesterol/gamma-HCH transport system substrate-binding protein
MENKAYAIFSGIFAILLTCALLAGLWWLAGTHTQQTTYQVLSKVAVSGLNQQASVRYRGVDIGRVSGIHLDPNQSNNILIDIDIDSSVRLTQGTYAQLASQGLTGLAYIELDDTGLNPAPLGKMLIPLRQSAINEIMNSGKAIIIKTEQLEENAARLLTTLNQLLNQQNTQKIAQLVDNMERSSEALEPLLRSTQQTSEKAGKLMDEIHPRELSNALDAVRQAALSTKETADTARPTLLKMQESLAEFERVSRHIEQVTADLGDNLNSETLPKAHELTDQLHRDAQSLNKLMDSLEQNPQSAIFGKPQAQPGPGEKGFQP